MFHITFILRIHISEYFLKQRCHAVSIVSNEKDTPNIFNNSDAFLCKSINIFAIHSTCICKFITCIIFHIVYML